jgi:hypothetical protein
MHLDDERIQRLLHDELGSAAAEIRLHVESCTRCRELVDEAREEERRIFGLLSQIDHARPAIDPRILLAGRTASGRQWGRRAAAVILGVAIAGAAYALPGSPLPAALDKLLGTGVARRDSAPVAPRDRVSAPLAGIAVPAEDGLVIRLLAEGEGAVATIELTGDEEVVVRAVEGSATFASDPGHLTVRSSGPVRLEIHIPRTAAAVEVRSGSTPVFRKLARGPVSEAAPDSMGRYIIPLRSSPPE